MDVVMVTYADDKKQLVEVYNLDESLPDHICWQLSEQGSCCQQSTSGGEKSKKRQYNVD
jgi:hypothetical protein